MRNVPTNQEKAIWLEIVATLEEQRASGATKATVDEKLEGLIINQLYSHTGDSWGMDGYSTWVRCHVLTYFYQDIDIDRTILGIKSSYAWRSRSPWPPEINQV
ncbi:MAG: hypothetical protein WAT81_04115 [Candidatus Moraniibacteriota bacterium]